MPVEFLTDSQAAAYASFDGPPSRGELDRFLFLDDGDRELIKDRSREHNRLRFAVQLASVRYQGVFLEDPLHRRCPQPATRVRARRTREGRRPPLTIHPRPRQHARHVHLPTPRQPSRRTTPPPRPERIGASGTWVKFG